jgi:hypothetical protein
MLPGGSASVGTGAAAYAWSASSDVSLADADDKNPEKRMKAAWARYQEREMPALKAEYKTLRLTQLKEMLWRKWQKSPENPAVAAAKAEAAASAAWKG